MTTGKNRTIVEKHLGTLKMKFLANALTFLVAIEHIGIMVLEMFFWDHPIGQRIFDLTPEVAATSAVLAANQGLYNGFLAAGLFWGLLSDKRSIKLFFLGCIVIAGMFGGLSAKTSILLTQALPALIAFLLTMIFTASNRPRRRIEGT